jgi:hypothetical protein
MLLRHRGPEIETRPVVSPAGLEHLSAESVAVLRWLSQWRIDHIVVGEVGRAIRGDQTAAGPVAIVPAPYRRNLERLASALSGAHARQRIDRAPDDDGEPPTTTVKLSADKLDGTSWKLRCGDHDLDIEARSSGVPHYQDLLWEAGPFELEPGLTVQVAALADLEYFDRGRRSGRPTEIRITRAERESSA